MSTTIRAVRLSGALGAALVLAACTTTLGRDFSDEYAQQIRSGETTKTEVLQKLGPPSMRRTGRDEETWTYAYYTGPGMVRWFNVNNSTEDAQYGRGNQKRLILVFSGDVVKSSTFTREIPEPH